MIRLTFDQACDARILALAHRRAAEERCDIRIDPPEDLVWLTRHQAVNPGEYHRALVAVDGDGSRIRLKQE